MSQENFTEPTPFLDDNKRAPYKLMRSLFIISNLSPKAFVTEKNLNENALKVIEQDDWEAIRDALREKNPDNIKTLAAIITDSSAGLELEIYSHKMAQIQDRMNHIKAHYQKWGDYFARSPDGAIIVDHLSQPVDLKIPSSNEELSGRKAHYELIMTYMKVLDSIDNLQNRLKGRVTQLTIETKKEIEFGHLLESKKRE